MANIGLKGGQIFDINKANRYIDFYNRYNNYQVVFTSKYWAIDTNGGDTEAEMSFFVNNYQDITVVGFHLFPSTGSSSGGYSVIDSAVNEAALTANLGTETKSTETVSDFLDLDGVKYDLEIKKAHYSYSVDGNAVDKNVWCKLDVAEDASKWNGTQTLMQVAVIVHRPSESKMDLLVDGDAADPTTDWNPLVTFFNDTTHRISYTMQVFNVNSGNSGRLFSKMTALGGYSLTAQDILDMELWMPTDYLPFLVDNEQMYLAQIGLPFGQWFPETFDVTTHTKADKVTAKTGDAYAAKREEFRRKLIGRTMFGYDGSAPLEENIHHISMKPNQAIQMFTKSSNDSINGADLYMADTNTSGYASEYFDGSFQIIGALDNYQLDRFPDVVFGFSKSFLGSFSLEYTLTVGTNVSVPYGVRRL